MFWWTNTQSRPMNETRKVLMWLLLLLVFAVYFRGSKDIQKELVLAATLTTLSVQAGRFRTQSRAEKWPSALWGELAANMLISTWIGTLRSTCLAELQLLIQNILSSSQGRMLLLLFTYWKLFQWYCSAASNYSPTVFLWICPNLNS